MLRHREGRHKPFYYREQLGDALTVDEGRFRIRLVPGEPSKRSLLLRLPSGPKRDIFGEGFTQGFRDWIQAVQKGQLTHQPEPNGRLILKRSLSDGRHLRNRLTEDTSVFYDREEQYTLDPRTCLPTRFQVLDVEGEVIEQVEAEYRELPAELSTEWNTLMARPNQVIADVTFSPHISEENSASKDGVTLQVIPLAMDTHGVVLTQIHGWLGATPIEAPLYMHVNPRYRTPAGMQEMPSLLCRDDRGRAYIEVVVGELWMLPNMWGGGVPRLRVFAPLSPGAPLPRRLTLQLGIAPWVSDTISGEAEGQNGVQSILLSTSLSVTMDLPRRTKSIDPMASLTHEWRWLLSTTGVPMPTLDAALESSWRKDKE
ncbi:MAG: hypothetical protein H7308_07505 [Chthonomonadaceae bacterium]|nr:hypothetical protein [Chthonomonadaceae bacterium]